MSSTYVIRPQWSLHSGLLSRWKRLYPSIWTKDKSNVQSSQRSWIQITWVITMSKSVGTSKQKLSIFPYVPTISSAGSALLSAMGKTCVCSARVVTMILGEVHITKYLHVYQIAHFDEHIVTNRDKNKEHWNRRKTTQPSDFEKTNNRDMEGRKGHCS